MSTAQTEARAIAQDIVDAFHPMDDVPVHMIVDVAERVIATAFAAKDAELSVQIEAKEHARRECDRAEAQLAEANKELEELAAIKADRDSYIDSHVTDVSVALDWKDRAEKAIAKAEGLMTELAKRDIQLEASAKVALDLSDKLAEAYKTLERLEEWAERAAFPTIADIARRAREAQGDDDVL